MKRRASKFFISGVVIEFYTDTKKKKILILKNEKKKGKMYDSKENQVKVWYPKRSLLYLTLQG